MKIQGNIKTEQNKLKPNTILHNNISNQMQKVSYSLYNSTCPLGANYYNPSFGKLSPQTALKRITDLKTKYAQYGMEYIAPKDTWSNKKIFNVLENIGKKYDELASKNQLSKDTLKCVLATILPITIADKIEVKDFKDLAHDLIFEGYEPDDVKNILATYGGMANNQIDKSTIYLPMTRIEIASIFSRGSSYGLNYSLQKLKSKCQKMLLIYQIVL